MAKRPRRRPGIGLALHGRVARTVWCLRVAFVLESLFIGPAQDFGNWDRVARGEQERSRSLMSHRQHLQLPGSTRAARAERAPG